jgi:hypothetical protein
VEFLPSCGGDEKLYPNRDGEVSFGGQLRLLPWRLWRDIDKKVMKGGSFDAN